MSELVVFQGAKCLFEKSIPFDERLDVLKKKLREFFNLKNVNFLFGSGTSYGAVSTMKELYENLKFSVDEAELEKEFRSIERKVGSNLEECLSIMYAARSYFAGIENEKEEDNEDIKTNIELYNKLIVSLR